MQWVRVRIRVRARAKERVRVRVSVSVRVRVKVTVRVSVSCAFSEAFVGIAAVEIAACTQRGYADMDWRHFLAGGLFDMIHEVKTICTELKKRIADVKTSTCRQATATICHRPGLQVMTRYTSCTHMDRSPLLYVHVGLPVQPTKAAW